MQIKTIKEFISKSNLPAKLIRSIIRQIGGWESFKEMAHDVYNHGADGGFHGFIYHADTVAFTKRNKKEIDEISKDMASEFGRSFSDFLCSFNCFKRNCEDEILDGYYNPKSDNRTQVYNALAWFALEEVSRSYTDLVEA